MNKYRNLSKKKARFREDVKKYEDEDVSGASQIEEKIYETSPHIKEFFDEVLNSKSLPFDLKVEFISMPKQKQMVKVKKISDEYKFLLKKEILFSFNEEIYNNMDENIRKILIEHEIDKVTINMETGDIKLIKPDLVTFSGLIKKYGVEEVERALKSESLFVEQQKEKSY